MTGEKQNLSSSESEKEVLLQEHQIVSSQILHFQEADNKGFEFTITAIGALAALSTFIVEQKSYILFLLLPIVFYAFTWFQVRRAIISNLLANYVISDLAPRIRNAVLNSATNHSDDFQTFSFWEEHIANTIGQKKSRFLSWGLGQAGKTILQVGTALVLTLAYFYFSQDPSYIRTIYDSLLIVVNLVLFAVTIYTLIVALSHQSTRK